MVEQLQKRQGWKTADDYTMLFNEIFFNAVLGWCLGTGYYAKPDVERAIAETCGFEEGEAFVAIFEPQGLFDHTAEWHLTDLATQKRIMHGKMPYADLEDMQPTDMTVEMFEKASVLGRDGKKGQ